MVWWIVLAASVAVYAALTRTVFSRVFFCVGKNQATDRGLVSFVHNNANSIVYEPAPCFRPYISQYVLSYKDGKISMMCKVDSSIDCIDYDVIIFNKRDRIISVLNVNEAIKTRGLTRKMNLPKGASYLSVAVNGVNGKELSEKKNKQPLTPKNAVLGLINCALAVGELFLVKLCLANLFADVFANDFLTSPLSTLITVCLGLGAGGINILFFFLYVNKAKAGAHGT